jgi:hypothetical protein
VTAPLTAQELDELERLHTEASPAPWVEDDGNIFCKPQADIEFPLRFGESGASLRAAGFRLEAVLPARGSWAQQSIKLKDIRDPVGTGNVERMRWVWP